MSEQQHARFLWWIVRYLPVVYVGVLNAAAGVEALSLRNVLIVVGFVLLQELRDYFKQAAQRQKER